jgi:hypothetical protein
LKQVHVLSLGAGVNSTALMVKLVEGGYPLDFAIFADTGAELPETYEAARMAEAYLGTRGIPLVTVRSRTTLVETLDKRKVIPDKWRRWQTRDKKITPIHAYYRSLAPVHVYEYIGIDMGEKRRAKPTRDPWITKIYPLVAWGMDRAACERAILKAGLPIPHKSSCYFCPFRARDEWEWLYRTHPDLFLDALRIEEASKHFPRQLLFPGGLRRLMTDLAKS